MSDTTSAPVIDVGSPTKVTPPYYSNGKVVVDPNDPNFAKYAGQVMGVSGPQWLPPGIADVLPKNVTYPLKLTFGAVPGPATVPVELPPPAPKAPSTAPPPAALSAGAIADKDFVPDPHQPVKDEDFVPDDPKASANEALYKPKILAEAKAQGLTDAQAQYLLGMAKYESGFNPQAKGTPDKNTGHQAVGIGQMYPDAMKDVGFKPEDMSDPDKQIAAMTAYYKQKLDKYNGNPDIAAMAYNQGDNPKSWQPIYAKNARTAGGIPLDSNFYSLAGQIFQQQHQANNPDDINQPWDYSTNTLNNVTLSGSSRVGAAIDASKTGQSYATERALSEAWHQQWLREHPYASMASDVQGFAIPDTLLARGAMAGGRAAIEAVPALARVLGPALGIGDAYKPVSAGIKALPRAMASGAATGVLNSPANPSGDLGSDAAFGAAGGLIAQPLALGAQVLGAAGKKIATAAGWTGENSLYNSVRQSLARTMGTDAPAMTPSQVPGVNYSLPEMLGGKNPDINAKFKDVAAADPIALQQQIEQNNAARVGYYQKIMKTPEDLANAKADLNANNQQISNLMDSQPAGPNPHGMTMQPVLDHVNKVLADRSKTPVENVPETMHEIRELLHEKVTLVNDVRSIHGLRRYLDGMLDKLDAPTSAPQRLLKKELTEIKGLVNEELNKIPGYKELMAKSGDIQGHIKELELLQERGKTITDIRDVMSPTVLNKLITDIETSHLVKGLTNKQARAKSVLPETLEKLKILRDDLKTSLATKVPVTLSRIAESAESGHVLGGLMHAAAGSTGALAGHATGLPYGGAAGYVAGVTTQQLMKRATAKAASRVDRITLDAMLHPHKYPPLAPTKEKVPGGFYSGMIGGNALNGFTQGGQDNKTQKTSGVKHDNENPTDDNYVSTAKAGEGSGGQDYPYTRSFDAGSFPSKTNWVKEGVDNPRFYQGIMGKVAQPKSWEFPETDSDLVTHMRQLAAHSGRDLTPDQMQSISDEWQAVRRSPIARLGFNLGHTMLSPPGYQYGDEAGLYSPQNDMLLATLDEPKGTLTHESIHRGIQILRANGLLKGMARFPDGFGNDGRDDDFNSDYEEGLVRRIMHDTMGDVQGKITPKDLSPQTYTKGGDLEAWEQKTINALNKAATKYILAQRAKGQRVDY